MHARSRANRLSSPLLSFSPTPHAPILFLLIPLHPHKRLIIIIIIILSLQSDHRSHKSSEPDPSSGLDPRPGTGRRLVGSAGIATIGAGLGGAITTTSTIRRRRRDLRRDGGWFAGAVRARRRGHGPVATTAAAAGGRVVEGGGGGLAVLVRRRDGAAARDPRQRHGRGQVFRVGDGGGGGDGRLRDGDVRRERQRLRHRRDLRAGEGRLRHGGRRHDGRVGGALDGEGDLDDIRVSLFVCFFVFFALNYCTVADGERDRRRNLPPGRGRARRLREGLRDGQTSCMKVG